MQAYELKDSLNDALHNCDIKCRNHYFDKVQQRHSRPSLYCISTTRHCSLIALTLSKQVTLFFHLCAVTYSNMVSSVCTFCTCAEFVLCVLTFTSSETILCTGTVPAPGLWPQSRALAAGPEHHVSLSLLLFSPLLAKMHEHGENAQPPHTLDLLAVRQVATQQCL